MGFCPESIMDPKTGHSRIVPQAELCMALQLLPFIILASAGVHPIIAMMHSAVDH